MINNSDNGSFFLCSQPINIFNTFTGVNTTKPGKLLPNTSTTFKILGKYSLPITISSVVISVTINSGTLNGSLNISQSNSPTRKAQSIINFTANNQITNQVTININNGDIVLYNNSNSAIDIAIELNGYYSNSNNIRKGSLFYPCNPYTLYDTKSEASGILKINETRQINVSFEDIYGSTPSAIVVNMVAFPTATGTITAGYNNNSNNGIKLSYVGTKYAASQAIIPLHKNTDGTYYFYVTALKSTAHLQIDVQGFFTNSLDNEGLKYVPLLENTILSTSGKNTITTNGKIINSGISAAKAISVTSTISSSTTTSSCIWSGYDKVPSFIMRNSAAATISTYVKCVNGTIKIAALDGTISAEVVINGYFI